MKKFCISILICLVIVLTLTLTSCVVDNGGTYYPTNDEMKTNLEDAGYEVEVFNDTTKNTIYGFSGSLLRASKRYNVDGVEKMDFLDFFRLEDAEDCDYIYGTLGVYWLNVYDSLVKIKNDEKFGNIVYCGTDNAINASGIKVVEVKV